MRDQTIESQGAPVRLTGARRWVVAIPFAAPAILYLSLVFALFAPLPLILLALRTERDRGAAALLLAIASNGLLVWLAGGSALLVTFAVFTLAPSCALPVFLRRAMTRPAKRSVEKAVFGTWLVQAALGVAILGGYAVRDGVSLFEEARLQSGNWVKVLDESLTPEARNELAGESPDPEAWKEGIQQEMPSALALLAFVIIMANLTTLLRLNPLMLRERLGLDPLFFRLWKAPEMLVWPTIAAGAVLLADYGTASMVGRNALKLFLAIYLVQGLSILAFYFDLWRLRGLPRSLAYGASVFLALPLVLGLGFFDQWFDFRSKFRQK